MAARPVEDIEAEASAWAARIDATSDAVPAGLQEWLERDRRNAGALLRAQASLALVASPAHSVAEHVAEPGGAARWRRSASWGLAAAGVAACVAALLLLVPTTTQQYETDMGEVRTLALSDGSSVAIDARSRLEVDYSQDARQFHLEAGKALFRAQHDEDRPFTVTIGDTTVTDIGTAFQVEQDVGTPTVKVIVTEGAVRVAAPGGNVLLKAGDSGRFSTSSARPTEPRLTQMSPRDLDRIVAWRSGRLVLSGETLSEAVAQFNNRNRFQIRVVDDRLGAKRLHGVFRLDDPKGFANAAALSVGAQVRPDGDTLLITP
jgi:transmembrane sensor